MNKVSEYDKISEDSDLITEKTAKIRNFVKWTKSSIFCKFNVNREYNESNSKIYYHQNQKFTSLNIQ